MPSNAEVAYVDNARSSIRIVYASGKEAVYDAKWGKLMSEKKTAYHANGEVKEEKNYQYFEGKLLEMTKTTWANNGEKYKRSPNNTMPMETKPKEAP
jgi:hypothetical protein